jgi:23S rRNA (pseudouridine1915-N3)-methyltransferase
VQVNVAWIGKTKEPAIQALTSEYAGRIQRYVDFQGLAFPSEPAFLKWVQKKAGRAAGALVLLDARGQAMSSEELAAFVEDHQTRNSLPLTFAIGPADGFSEDTHRHASRLLSLSRLTLPHELARVVLLEQIYRAFTIIHRHPYHVGH